MIDERDPLDIATIRAEADRAAGEAAHRAMMAAIQPTTECTSCGEPIPEERRTAIRTNVCISCAAIAEKRRTQHARR